MSTEPDQDLTDLENKYGNVIKKVKQKPVKLTKVDNHSFEKKRIKKLKRNEEE